MRVPTADVRNPPVLESRVNRPGPDRKHLFVVCDDGVAYEFERWSDERVFTPVARWDGADRNASPARLPSAVEIFVRNYCARNDLHLS